MAWYEENSISSQEVRENLEYNFLKSFPKYKKIVRSVILEFIPKGSKSNFGSIRGFHTFGIGIEKSANLRKKIQDLILNFEKKKELFNIYHLCKLGKAFPIDKNDILYKITLLPDECFNNIWKKIN